MTISFQRARKPEEISIRREAILAAAAELFDEGGAEAAGLNAIAARAGFTKSNVYRYFESREAVLIELFLSDFVGLGAALETALGGLPPGDVEAVAHVVATAFVERPRLCKLLSILAGVLERNVSEDAVVVLKTEILGITNRVTAAMARALPRLSVEDCGWGTAAIGNFLSGLWPAAHPSPTVARVLSRPEFMSLKLTVERDLERMILVLLRGLGA